MRRPPRSLRSLPPAGVPGTLGRPGATGMDRSRALSKIFFVALAFTALALYPLVAGSFGIDLVT